MPAFVSVDAGKRWKPLKRSIWVSWLNMSEWRWCCYIMCNYTQRPTPWSQRCDWNFLVLLVMMISWEENTVGDVKWMSEWWFVAKTVYRWMKRGRVGWHGHRSSRFVCLSLCFIPADADGFSAEWTHMYLMTSWSQHVDSGATLFFLSFFLSLQWKKETMEPDNVDLLVNDDSLLLIDLILNKTRETFTVTCH